MGGGKALVGEILDLRAQLRRAGARVDETGVLGDAEDVLPDETEDASDAPPPFDREAALAALRAKMSDLTQAQGESPLILPSVDKAAVASVVQDWTGIPMGRMLASQTEKALTLAASLARASSGRITRWR